MNVTIGQVGCFVFQALYTSCQNHKPVCNILATPKHMKSLLEILMGKVKFFFNILKLYISSKENKAHMHFIDKRIKKCFIPENCGFFF